MSGSLTWLHISDIHFLKKNDWRDCPSRRALLEHLEEIFSGDDSLRPDFVFCTGDIAFGETKECSLPDQYSRAKEFFIELLRVSGRNGNPLPKERLFVVPGNHDVARSCVNSDAQATINQWAGQPDAHVNKINQRFNDRTVEFKETIKRLDAYGEFVREFLPHQNDSDGRHHYTRITELGGIKIGVAGFNSSWTCAGPEDERNLWLAANWQFETAYSHLKDADIRIGLIHHPLDWLNASDREIANRRLASDYHFWLHGHSHNAWVTPVQSHVIIAAGAVGAQDSDEFGVNLTRIDLNSIKGVTHLHSKRAASNGWTVAPIARHAPYGQWAFELPSSLRSLVNDVAIQESKYEHPAERRTNDDFIGRQLKQRLQTALQSFSSQPEVWVDPVLCKKSELARDANDESPINLMDLVANPTSHLIKAPPQHGLTCLALFLVREAWFEAEKSFWLYLNAEDLKPNAASINAATQCELSLFGVEERDIKCVILDSWSPTEKDALKLLKKVTETFSGIPVICMERADIGQFRESDKQDYPVDFNILHLWSLSRESIRKIVASYNDERHIGDEDAVTKRLVSDLEVLNLHRTPLNCITLLKVSEIDFDESPVNRSEVIKRVLFLLFNVDDIPTYKSRPDVKDCEFVLGYFCETLIREGGNSFTRDKFLRETQKICHAALIDLETQVLFDVIVRNNILVRRGSYFSFKFTYWIFYFAAQRMHHDAQFAAYIFDKMRYSQHPELIEFYTGIDRKRDDALEVLIRDIRECRESVQKSCGLPEQFNPYDKAAWNPTAETEEQMQKVIADGVQDSSLPAAIKDQFADRVYDRAKPYDQTISSLLVERSFTAMMRTMKSGARALRNSDYVSPDIKRRLLEEIFACWEQASKILMIVIPALAVEGRARYDDASFFLVGDFGETPQERFVRILCEIPFNIVSWFKDDLFSRKMGPLLIDQLESPNLDRISRHELMVLLIHGKPKNWNKKVQRYIAENKRNSYYLYDIYRTLRHEYQYGFSSPQVLKDIEHLIKMAATKHLTGAKEPGVQAIKKVRWSDEVIPQRES